MMDPELLKAAFKAIRRFKRLSKRERLRRLHKLGIISRKGRRYQLAKRYGGP